MSFLNRLLGRGEPSSKEVAKERLRLVLSYDRTDISPRVMEILKTEIITVISKHVPVDRDGIKIQLSHSRGHSRLMATIPLIPRRDFPYSGPDDT